MRFALLIYHIFLISKCVGPLGAISCKPMPFANDFV